MTRSDALRESEREAMLDLGEGIPVLCASCGNIEKGPCNEQSGTALSCQTQLPQQFHTFLRRMLLWSQMLTSCGKLKRKVLLHMEHCRFGTLWKSGALPSNLGSGILCVLFKEFLQPFSISLSPSMRLD